MTGILGQGGCGVVFDVHDEATNELRALKIMRRSAARDRLQAIRFMREVTAITSLASEHVVRVVDAGTDHERSYLVMERLVGQSLHQRLVAARRLGVREVANVGLEVCEGLAHAHASGIVHRDVKPSNIFLARLPGGREIVKVLDFGVSKMRHARRGADDRTITSSGALLGSPRYMAPEQIRCARNVDARADVWGLGAVLYTMLAGRAPFGAPERSSLAVLTTAILEDPYVPFQYLGRAVPKPLEAVIARSLSRNLAFRFSDVAQVAAGLAPFASPERGPRVRAIAAILAGSSVMRSADVSSSSSSPSPSPSPSRSCDVVPAVVAPTVAQQTTR